MAEAMVTQMMADMFKALSHPMRVKIIQAVGDEEQCACELVRQLGIEQSNLSQHLSILKARGILTSRKEGQKVFYRVLFPEILEVIDSAEKTLREQIQHRQRLLTLLK